MNMDQLLHDVAMDSLQRMKSHQVFPYRTGYLKNHSDTTVKGDALSINFNSSYSLALAQGSRHHQFGDQLVKNEQEALADSLKKGYISQLRHALEPMEGDFK